MNVSFFDFLCFSAATILCCRSAYYFWSLLQLTRCARHRVIIHFCSAQQIDAGSFGRSAVIVRHRPLIWDTSLPVDEIYRHIPPIGSEFDDKYVAAWQVVPL